MKPTLAWCKAARAELGSGAVLAGSEQPNEAATYIITPSRMDSPFESGSLGAQTVTSQVEIICYTLQKQEARITSAAREVWTRVDEQIEKVHHLGRLGVEEVVWAVPVACNFEVAPAGEPWHIAAAVTMELVYQRALTLGA